VWFSSYSVTQQSSPEFKNLPVGTQWRWENNGTTCWGPGLPEPRPSISAHRLLSGQTPQSTSLGPLRCWAWNHTAPPSFWATNQRWAHRAYKTLLGWTMALLVEHLPSKSEALSSNPKIARPKKKKTHCQGKTKRTYWRIDKPYGWLNLKKLKLKGQFQLKMITTCPQFLENKTETNSFNWFNLVTQNYPREKDAATKWPQEVNSSFSGTPNKNSSVYPSEAGLSTVLNKPHKQAWSTKAQIGDPGPSAQSSQVSPLSTRDQERCQSIRTRPTPLGRTVWPQYLSIWDLPLNCQNKLS
jgi:hypothetical protein